MKGRNNLNYLNELIAGVGGGVIVFGGILAFAKSIITKYIEALIESESEKSIKKIENKYTRNLSAYEILLKKEFNFYEYSDSIYAELIVRIQDLSAELQGIYGNVDIVRFQNIKSELLYVLKNIPLLKKNLLLNQVYIPKDIYETTSDVVIILQRDVNYLNIEFMKLNDGKEHEVNFELVSKLEKEILESISKVEICTKKRLVFLSEG